MKARLSRVLALHLVALSSLALHPPIRDEEAIQVLEVSWARDVADREPVDAYAADAAASGSLVFWTRLGGREKALATLRANGRLPIRHRWWRYVGARPLQNNAVAEHDLVVEFDYPLTGATSESADALEREVVGRSFFDWRTWSKRPNARSGTYCVEILFNDGEKVPLAADVETNGTKMCRFRAEVS